MCPLWGLMLWLCLQCGHVCNAVQKKQTLDLVVKEGESVLLPCNGSAYQEQEGSVHWDTIEGGQVYLRGGKMNVWGVFKGRIQMPSEEQVSVGDWSLVLQHTVLSDSSTYECFWQEETIISTVNIMVIQTLMRSSLVVSAGDTVDLACYIPNDQEAWWTRNGSAVVSAAKENFSSSDVVSNFEDISRSGLLEDASKAKHLYISPAMMSDTGEYRCYYKDYRGPRSGTPQKIRLTVLETNPTGSTEASSDTVPVIQIGIITGVLLVALVVLCVVVLKVMKRI